MNCYFIFHLIILFLTSHSRTTKQKQTDERIYKYVQETHFHVIKHNLWLILKVIKMRWRRILNGSELDDVVAAPQSSASARYNL